MSSARRLATLLLAPCLAVGATAGSADATPVAAAEPTYRTPVINGWYPIDFATGPGGVHHVLLSANASDVVRYGTDATGTWAFRDFAAERNGAHPGDLTLDAAGNVYIVTSRAPSVNGPAVALSTNADGGWVTEPVVTWAEDVPDWQPEWPRVAVGIDGGVHVVWKQNLPVFYRARSSTGWGPIEAIDPLTVPAPGATAVVTDGSGTPHVLISGFWGVPDSGICSDEATCLVDVVPSTDGWVVTPLAPTAATIHVDERPGPVRVASGAWYVTNESGGWVTDQMPGAPTFGSLFGRPGGAVIFGAETGWGGVRRYERTAAGWSVTPYATDGEYPAMAAADSTGTEHVIMGEGTWTNGAFSGRTVLAAPDRTAPTAGRPLVRLVPGTILGSTVNAYVYWPYGDKGGSGIARFRVDMRTNAGTWTRVNSTTTTANITRTLNTGTATTYQFRVQALDNAGNGSAWYEGPVLKLPVLQETDAGMKFTPLWRVARPTGASGGSTKYATATNAVLEHTFRGRGYALVAPMGPQQGSVNLSVDGQFVRTISLYSPTYRPRVVVYSTAWNSWATHTVSLVTLGTAGHPRVDIDAAVLGG